MPESVRPPDTAARLRDFPDELSVRELEGETASAVEVGGARKSSAEKARSRAGSPTRATRYSPSYRPMLTGYPALP
jgi:hypothetical protein